VRPTEDDGNRRRRGGGVGAGDQQTLAWAVFSSRWMRIFPIRTDLATARRPGPRRTQPTTFTLLAACVLCVCVCVCCVCVRAVCGVLVRWCVPASMLSPARTMETPQMEPAHSTPLY
jgi:hypothetical protein